MNEKDFTLWLEFEEWEPRPDDDPYSDFFNMQIKLKDGTEYALNVWTFKHFETAIEEIKESGEYLSGKYLPPPDLFVEKLDRKLIEECVSDLISKGELREKWRITET